MNSHKNARTTLQGRILLIERIGAYGLMPAAEAAGITVPTARKWRQRVDYADWTYALQVTRH